MTDQRIIYFQDRQEVRFVGPGGFTTTAVSLIDANAIAYAWGIKLEVI